MGNERQVKYYILAIFIAEDHYILLNCAKKQKNFNHLTFF